MTIIRRLRSASELGRRVRVRIVLRDSAAQTRLRARQPRLPSLPGPAGRGKALACAEHPARRLVQRVGAYPPQPRRPPSSSHRHGKLKAEHTASAGSFSVKVLGAQTAGRRMPLESAVSGGGVFASQVVRGRRRDVFPRGCCPAALLSRCVGAGHAPGRARQRKRRGRVVGRTEEVDADRLLRTWLSPAGSARPPLGQTGRGHAAGAARAACLPPRGDAQRVQKPERAGGAGLGGPRASPPGPESGAGVWGPALCRRGGRAPGRVAPAQGALPVGPGGWRRFLWGNMFQISV